MSQSGPAVYARDLIGARGLPIPAVCDPYSLGRFIPGGSEAAIGPEHVLYGWVVSKLFHPDTIVTERNWAATYDGMA